jgi:hypothetical protein
MKAKSLNRNILFLILGIFISPISYSQEWGGNVPLVQLTSWSVNINGGLTSYFGDLSPGDLNLRNKLSHESGPAASIILTRNVYRDAIGFSGQVLAGRLEGRLDNVSFAAKVIEYNLHARVDFVRLIMPNTYNAFGVVGYAGAGQFLFSTIKVVANDGFLESYSQKTEVPEFVVFFGGGMYYKINSNLGITADLSIHHCQNDRLDDEVKNDDYDYFSYLNIGVSYFINTVRKREPNLANFQFLFKNSTQPTHYD